MGLIADAAIKFITLLSLLRSRVGVFFLVRYIRRHAGSFGGMRLNGWGSFSGIENLNIGNNVHVGVGALWSCEGGVTIGDNAHISRFVTIYSRNHNYKGRRLPYDEAYDLKEVVIGKNVWIGSHVIILPGTIIGEGAIIGAGAIVSGTVPPCAIWGMKGHGIGKRDEDHYFALDASGSFGGANGKEI